MNINIFELGAVLLAGVFFAIIYFLGKVKKYDFGLLTILGLVFGVAVGLIFKGHYLYLEAIGTIYSHLIDLEHEIFFRLFLVFVYLNTKFWSI